MSIEKRKGKRGTTYRVAVYNKGRKITTASFDTLVEARVYESEVKSAVNRGSFVDLREADALTLGDALDRYVDTVSREKRNAYAREHSQTVQIKKYRIASLTLGKIRSSDVARFRDERLSTRSPNTVRLGLALISSVFVHACKEWSFDSLANPVLGIRKPSVVDSARDRRLVGDEYARVMQSAKKYRGSMRLIIPFAIETAMRQAEIAGIYPKHVNLINRTVVLHMTKNGSSRTVPLSRKAYRIVGAAMRSCGDGPLFGMSAEGIKTAWRRIVQRAVPVVEDLHFHDLRHEATSRLFERGLSTEQVKSITGHKTYSMLARYTHLKASDLVSLLG